MKIIRGDGIISKIIRLFIEYVDDKIIWIKITHWNNNFNIYLHNRYWYVYI